MKSADEIKKFFKSAAIDTNPKMDEAVLNKVLIANEKTTNPKSAAIVPNLRRTIMKSRITKLAMAAAVIVVVVLGLFEFIGNDAGSGVVWAEVVKKVQASRGVIFRSKDIMDWRDDPPDYTMKYYSSTYSRLDSYKGDQIIRTIYGDCNTKTVVLVDHGHKSYVKMTPELTMPDGFGMADPNSMVQNFLSHEHRKLGPKTVEGVLCEGIETTDPAYDGYDYTDSVMARIWVSVETGYPVQLEVEIVRNNGEIRIGGVSDQFQWDVELDESLFEPNIPPDYIDISL